MTDVMPAAQEDDAKPFLEHLEELRGTLLWCLGALSLGVLCTVAFTPRILAWLMAPLDGVVDNPRQFLRSLHVTGAFFVWLRIAAWSGLLVSAPAIVYFLARFIFPGLKEHEREILIKASAFAVLMFSVGVAFAYKVWVADFPSDDAQASHRPGHFGRVDGE